MMRVVKVHRSPLSNIGQQLAKPSNGADQPKPDRVLSCTGADLESIVRCGEFLVMLVEYAAANDTLDSIEKTLKKMSKATNVNVVQMLQSLLSPRNLATLQLANRDDEMLVEEARESLEDVLDSLQSVTCQYFRAELTKSLDLALQQQIDIAQRSVRAAKACASSRITQQCTARAAQVSDGPYPDQICEASGQALFFNATTCARVDVNSILEQMGFSQCGPNVSHLGGLCIAVSFGKAVACCLLGSGYIRSLEISDSKKDGSKSFAIGPVINHRHIQNLIWLNPGMVQENYEYAPDVGYALIDTSSQELLWGFPDNYCIADTKTTNLLMQMCGRQHLKLWGKLSKKFAAYWERILRGQLSSSQGAITRLINLKRKSIKYRYEVYIGRWTVYTGISYRDDTALRATTLLFANTMNSYITRHKLGEGKQHSSVELLHESSFKTQATSLDLFSSSYQTAGSQYDNSKQISTKRQPHKRRSMALEEVQKENIIVHPNQIVVNNNGTDPNSRKAKKRNRILK